MDEVETLVEDITASTLEEDTARLETVTVKLGWLSRRRFEQALAAYGLTAPQYVALRWMLDCREGCSMTELAEATYQVSATMTGIVDRLVERGLVRRERLPNDRRALRVVVTPEGEALMEKIMEHKRAWLRQFLQGLTPEERRVMIEMATRYMASVEQGVAPA